MKPSVFHYYLRNRPLFLAMIRSCEIELYQKYITLTGRVLDFGSGDGFFLDTIHQFYPKLFQTTSIVGIDVNKTSLDESRKYNLYDQLVLYDGHKLPFHSNSFDAVFSNCVFEHLPDLELNLAEMYRVLKPGGKLFTTVMAAPWDQYMVLPKSFWRKKQVHINLLTDTIWQEKFTSTGFVIKKMAGYLNLQQSHLVELSHFLSVPYLLSYKMTHNWSLVGSIYTHLVPINKVVNIFKEDVPTKKAAALYFTLQKPRN